MRGRKGRREREGGRGDEGEGALISNVLYIGQ